MKQLDTLSIALGTIFTFLCTLVCNAKGRTFGAKLGSLRLLRQC